MTFYFCSAASYSVFLIYRMFQDQECSKTDFFSWLIIAIASLLWIVVIPISILELQAKAKAKTTSRATLQTIKNQASDSNTTLTDY
jgi:hypothetical protein